MISFTLPWALLGLAAAGIPLYLHLVQRNEPREMLFPAVRYLEATTRDHRRRLQVRNLLLLLLRTLLIIALVLAAAGATVNRGGLGSHAPSALVLVVDNSASSATMHDGEAALVGVVAAAATVLDRATLADRLWLVTADGVVVPGTAAELRARLRALRSEPVRLDLGAAVSHARDLVRSSGRAGEVVVISDMQRTALGGASGTGDVLVLRPSQKPPPNHSLSALSAGSQPWGPAGGQVTVSVTSSDTVPLPVTLSLGTRRLRDVLVTPGVPSVQRIGPVTPGWTTITASLPPDEFRRDDERTVTLRVAPPAVVRWDPRDRYVSAALDVLAADGRVRAGEGVRFGSLGPGASVVVPPDDPAQLGALNRALAARGVGWRFGNPVVANGRTDSCSMLPTREVVTRRVALESAGGADEVLATVDGAPWLVHSGELLLLGSRFDPSWSALPFSASFVPFLDALLTRAQGQSPMSEITVGAAFRIPDEVTVVSFQGQREVVAAGMAWHARQPGSYLLLAGADTVGGLSASLDARESDLTPASDAAVRTLWGDVTISNLDGGARRAFARTGRGDLRVPLLALALCCALVETGVLRLAHRRPG